MILRTFQTRKLKGVQKSNVEGQLKTEIEWTPKLEVYKKLGNAIVKDTFKSIVKGMSNIEFERTLQH